MWKTWTGGIGSEKLRGAKYAGGMETLGGGMGTEKGESMPSMEM